ncbi:serine/threonine-protein kinase pim-2-like [Mugil cephalus]|uniref:serine/threonine-protein kinase pim-2-like n=1 Tax=Mugil cephalus TaxID=48193 RepID=UPI001FB80707|nr:serine/threonine-protein kinase pim-2-like [Mugil cephalus]
MTRNSPAMKRGRDSSTEQQSATSSNDLKGAKGKAVGKKRTRVAELAEPRTSSEDGGGLRGQNRKIQEDGEGPLKKTKKRKHLVLEESISTSADPVAAEFEAKYEQQEPLGKGGCGCVFAGFRRADNLPVAIKHIAKDKVYCKQVDKNGRQLSSEVAVMLKLAAGRRSSVPAVVSMLDWYDLDDELILVLERPVPSHDLFRHIEVNGGSLQEEEAKVILRQLVIAAKDLQGKCIFHRDIKIENILIETGSDVPQVRIIDFGLSCFTKQRSFYRTFYGTSEHTPPEWFSRSSYTAGPTTVWQLGVVMFEMLHRNQPFETRTFLKKKTRIRKNLSEDCQDVLTMCLSKDPNQRPTLDQLLRHPWLI